MDNPKKITLTLSNLHCYFVEEHNYDDVYLKYNGKKIWPLDKKNEPMRIDTSQSLNIDLPDLIEGDEVVIELWDWDLLSPDDLLGSFKLIVAEGGPFSTDMELNLKKTKKAKYTLDWEAF